MLRWLLFIFMISLPFMGMCLGYSDSSKKFEAIEQRPKTRLAYADLSAPSRLPDKVSASFDDNFGFREVLIDGYAALLYKLFRKTINQERVVAGKDDFFFLGNYFSQVIDANRGRLKITDRKIHSYVEALLCRQRAAERQGIEFYLAVAPNKHSIYPEKLPPWCNPKKAGNLYDRFYLQAEKSDLNLIKIKDRLLFLKPQYGEMLYQKSDSHWTDLGAYIAAKEVLTHFGDAKVCLPANLSSLEHARFYKFGDLLTMARITSLFGPEDFYNEFLKWPESTGSLSMKSLLPDAVSNSFSSVPDNFQIAYLNDCIIKNNRVKSGLKCLFLRDSFCTQMSPFFNQAFSEIIYLHYEKAENSNFSELLERFKPDMVVFEFVERQLLSTRVHSVNNSLDNLPKLSRDNSYKKKVKRVFGEKFILREISFVADKKGLELSLLWESRISQKLKYINAVHLVDQQGNIIDQVDRKQNLQERTAAAGEQWSESFFFSTERLENINALAFALYASPDRLLTVDSGVRDWQNKRLIVSRSEWGKDFSGPLDDVERENR